MGLPKIDQPLFDLIVPSTGEKVQYRPFTVKEEKILLIAQEAKDIDQIILAIKQIINNCVIGIDVDTMPIFDLEYIIICIRAKSVDNKVSFSVKDPDTEEEIALSIDINEIKITHNPDHNKEVVINDDYYLMMRYPTVEGIKALVPVYEGESETETMFRTMVECMDCLVNKTTDEVLKFSDFTPEEIDEFVGQFTKENVTAMQKFFETVPRMKYSIPYKDNTGKEKTFTMEGIDTFFT